MSSKPRPASSNLEKIDRFTQVIFHRFCTFHDGEYITRNRNEKDESSKRVAAWNKIVADPVWKKMLLKPIANIIHSVVDQVWYRLLNELIKIYALINLTDIMYAKYGIPKEMKARQKILPYFVSGAMFPYPIVDARVPAKKNALW